MIKKIILIFLLFCLTNSCGKKGDPVYKESKKRSEFEKSLSIEINEIYK
tara:strand:+ start:195 stop:341 length:147 start_codon:yes stop_codon:yes gene_type:complete